ncbi:hypothetical protein FAI40_04585 [Acetobacteraceae bacterium]|nr:hypothetical protein FAI40_04585 [Acetobacteraceae bacterium]
MIKSIEYLINKGKDKGKLFVISRLPLLKADKLAVRVLQDLAKAQSFRWESNPEINIANLKATAIERLLPFINANISEQTSLNLLDCCKIKRDPENPLAKPSKILEGDLEDPITFMELQNVALNLHIDFIKATSFQLAFATETLSQAQMARQKKGQNCQIITKTKKSRFHPLF